MKLVTCMLAIACWSVNCSAQSDTTATVVPTDSIKPKASLTLGTSYSNNADYYGQRAQKTTPYIAVAANYKLKSGLYFSGLAYRLLNDTGALVSAENVGAGIAFKLNKRWSADLGYSHTFYPAYSPFLQASNPDNATASLVYDNWLSSKVNVDYAFGKTRDVFVTVGTGKQVTLGSISPKDIITLTPEVTVSGGTQHFYQTYITEKRLRDSTLGMILTPVFGSPSPPPSTTKTTSSTQFNVLSYNIKCPLAYNRAHYLFEVAYQLSVLSKHADTQNGKNNSFFSASFYYQF